MTKEEALKKYGLEIDKKGFLIEEPPVRQAELFAAMDDYAQSEVKKFSSNLPVSGRSEQFNCVHSYDHVLTVKNLKYKCKYCKHEKWEQLN